MRKIPRRLRRQRCYTLLCIVDAGAVNNCQELHTGVSGIGQQHDTSNLLNLGSRVQNDFGPSPSVRGQGRCEVEAEQPSRSSL